MTRWLTNPGPEIELARTISRSSFTIIGRGADLSSHWTWNQLWPCHAPQPHESDASDAIYRQGRQGWGKRKEIPFTLAAKVCHHIRSDRKSRFRRMGCGRVGCAGTSWSKLIIRRRKERPHRTTLHAWFKVPMSDSSSRRLKTFLSPHSARIDWRRRSFSCGRCNWPAVVSTSMPQSRGMSGRLCGHHTCGLRSVCLVESRYGRGWPGPVHRRKNWADR